MTKKPDKEIPDSSTNTLSGIVTMLPGDRGKLPFGIGKHLKLQYIWQQVNMPNHISCSSFLADIFKWMNKPWQPLSLLWENRTFISSEL